MFIAAMVDGKLRQPWASSTIKQCTFTAPTATSHMTDNLSDCVARTASMGDLDSKRCLCVTLFSAVNCKHTRCGQARTFSTTNRANAGVPRTASTDGEQYLCVTFIAAVDGKLRLPRTISTVSELRTALAQLAGVPADNLIAFELLWTPQARCAPTQAQHAIAWVSMQYCQSAASGFG
jgi:hypothetical protein